MTRIDARQGVIERDIDRCLDAGASGLHLHAGPNLVLPEIVFSTLSPRDSSTKQQPFSMLAEPMQELLGLPSRDPESVP